MKETPMNTIRLALISLALAPAIAMGAASAQTNPPAAPSAPMAPVTSSPPASAAAPVPGANSFTKGEARSRIEANGYTNVTGLQKDSRSIWRGKAMKDGKSVTVSLDFQGHVVAQ
jgi:hypothetical protein